MDPLAIGYRFLRPWPKCKPCHTHSLKETTQKFQNQLSVFLARKMLKRPKDDDVSAMAVPQ